MLFDNSSSAPKMAGYTPENSHDNAKNNHWKMYLLLNMVIFQPAGVNRGVKNCHFPPIRWLSSPVFGGVISFGGGGII